MQVSRLQPDSATSLISLTTSFVTLVQIQNSIQIPRIHADNNSNRTTKKLDESWLVIKKWFCLHYAVKSGEDWGIIEFHGKNSNLFY